jgi:TetR/AcrR family transcriptional regulator, transcriptional repressor for nem operon
MTKSERTRKFIIEKTAPLFNKYGYDGTSLTILQEVTGLTKGSLYGNFRDKEEIALEAFRHSMEVTREFVQGKIARKKTSKDKLVALLNFYAEYVFNPPVEGGCPLLNTAVEADDFHTFMKGTVAEEIEKTVTMISSILEEGKKNGEFRADVKSRELAYLFFSSVEGAIMVSRVSSSDMSMKAVIKHCKNILDLIGK